MRRHTARSIRVLVDTPRAIRAVATALTAMLALAGPAAAQIGPRTFLVGVGETTGSGGGEEMEHFGRGLGDLITTDLTMLRDDPRYKDCDIGIVAWRQWDLIRQELALQQSRFIDPRSITIRRMPREPNALIEGSVAQSGNTLSWSITMRERASGKVLATSEGSVPTDRIMEISEAVARQMMDAACPPGWDASGGGAKIRLTGHVARLDAPFRLTGNFPGATADFAYTPTSDAGGTLTYTFAGGGVTGAGSGTYTLAAQGDQVYRLDQTTKGCVNGAPNSCRTNSETITLTPVKK